MYESGRDCGKPLVARRAQELLEIAQCFERNHRVRVQQEDVVVRWDEAEPGVDPGSESEIAARVDVLGTVGFGHRLHIMVTRVVDDPHR